ncbi:MAG: hypothetical protein KY468_16810 [Armatimonadetes bacterium]|nr:hypothetical protein [Armatimonadota bacterium]
MKRIFPLTFLLLVPIATAWADSIRWIGWSTDGQRYAYFHRQPYGESGYTDIHIIARDTATDREVARYTVRSARRLLETPPVPEETEETLQQVETAWVDHLAKKGYRPGQALIYETLAAQPRRVGGQTIPVMTAQVAIKRSRQLYLTPTSTRLRAHLQAHSSRLNPRGRRVDSQPIPSQPHMTGLPGERVYRIPPTHPTGIYLSPNGRWIASMWLGQATLPDGLSWPAYVFHFPVSALPR